MDIKKKVFYTHQESSENLGDKQHGLKQNRSYQTYSIAFV